MKHQAILTVLSILSGVQAGVAEVPAGYPQTCAWIDYCGPISGAEWSTGFGGAPQLFIKSAFGSALIQRDLKIERSRDSRSHVCMRYDPFGDLEVTCLMVPVLAR